MRDKNEGQYRGEGPATTPVVQDVAEGKTTPELSWKKKAMKENNIRIQICCAHRSPAR